MIIFTRVPDYIRNRYVSWKGDSLFGRQGWLNKSTASESYYYNDVEYTGTTYTSSQYNRIMEVTGIPVSINYLHPVTNQKLAILTQTKPSMRTISIDGRARDHATVLDKMKTAVLYNSMAPMEIESAIKDMLIAGMGGLMVIPMNMYQGGMFGVGISYIPYDEYILDINAKKRSLEDMEGFFIEKAFTVPKAMQLYGHIISQLKDENGNPVEVGALTSQTWDNAMLTDKQDVTTTRWNMDDRIVVREYYEKVYTTMYVVPDKDGNFQYLFAENLEGDAQALLGGATGEFPGIYIKRYLMMGDFLIFQELLPITQWPLKVTFFEWGGRPYRSYGMIHFTKDMQAAFDKLIQIMLLHGILSNNAGWVAPKGSIAEEDRKKWEEYGANPRVIKEYIPREVAGMLVKPERDDIAKLSNFYPTILEMLKSGIEYSTGISAIISGDAKEAQVEVFSSLQQYQNAAMQRIILSTTHVNQMMSDLGQVLVEYLTANITPDTYQFFDESGNLNELKVAKEITNDIKLFRYMVVSIPSTYMPTQRLAVSTELMKIAQSSPDPTERSLYTQTAMDLAEIREFSTLREKLDVVRNTQAKLQQLQEAYDRLMETSKQMENKYINISLENRILKEVDKGEKKVAASYAATETKLDILNKSIEEGEREKKNNNKE